jgi:hypothetical protein
MKLIHVPRTLAILFILFISLFALDSFPGEASFLQELVGFLIHLIPSFVMIGLLAISWNRPLVGGWLFGLLAVLFTVRLNNYRSLFQFAVLSLPLIIISVLFFVCGLKKRPRQW